MNDILAMLVQLGDNMYDYSVHLSVNLKNATPLTRTKCEKWTLITEHFE